MSVRPTLRVGPALLGLALIVGACSGSSGTQAAATGQDTGANGGNGSSPPAATSPEPTFDLGPLLSPDPTPDATLAAIPSTPANAPQATPKQANPTPPAVSTSHAASLLSQVDQLLNEIDGELSNADAAATNPGE